jgi:hypothetical protein
MMKKKRKRCMPNIYPGSDYRTPGEENNPENISGRKCHHMLQP